MRWSLLIALLVMCILGCKSIRGQNGEQDDTLVFSSNDISVGCWKVSNASVRIGMDGIISITDEDGRTVSINFAGDTVTADGKVLDSHVETFCWAVIKLMQEKYSKEWERIVYLENSYNKYRAALEPKYRKALELYLQQLKDLTNTQKMTNKKKD